MKKIWIGIGIIAITILVIVLVVTQITKKAEEIKIGVVLPLTGDAAMYGAWSKNGMELAAAELNQNNQSPRIKLIYEDSQSTAQGDINSFQKLISVNKVSVAVGFILSNGALACAPIANSSKVVLLSTSASTEKFKDAGDYVFRLRESGIIHGNEMAKYAKRFLNAKNAGLIYANAENGITYASSFGKEFGSLGGQVVYDEKYTEKETDFRSILVKLKEKNPDVVYLAGLAPDMGNILRQARELGIKTQWLASPGAENPKLLELAKEASEGLIFTTPAFNPESNENNIRNFVKKYKDIYGETPEFLAANGYDAIMILNKITREYGISSEAIKNGLYQTKDFPGIGGKISFDEFGEVIKLVLFKKILNGKFVILSLSEKP